MHNLDRQPKLTYKSKYQIGISNEFRLNPKISIITELFYEKRFVYVSKISAYGPEIYPYAFKLNYSLISLPILFKIRTKFLHQSYFLTGVRFHNIVKAMEDFADCGGFYRYDDVSGKMPNLTYGIDIGIGKELSLSRFNLIIVIRYTLDVRPFPPAEYTYPVLINIFTNHSVFLNIGISYPITWHHNK